MIINPPKVITERKCLVIVYPQTPSRLLMSRRVGLFRIGLWVIIDHMTRTTRCCTLWSPCTGARQVFPDSTRTRPSRRSPHGTSWSPLSRSGYVQWVSIFHTIWSWINRPFLLVIFPLNKKINDFQNAMSDYFMFEKYIVGPNMCIFTIHEIFAAM